MNCTEPDCNGVINDDGFELPVGCNRGIIRPTVEVFECADCGRLHSFNEKKDLVGLFTGSDEKVFRVSGKIINK
jgi:hypothetical protein